MSLIKRMRRQFAVYWAPNGNDDFGNPKYLPPVQIKCRWEGKVQQITNYKGQIVMSMARVYTDRDITPGGVLWEGKLGSISSQTNPFDNPLAFEVQAFGKIPNLKAKEFLREARL